MKKNLIPILAVALFASHSHATTIIVGDQLQIGTNIVYRQPSGAIGASNTVDSPHSFALGVYNSINQDQNDYAVLAVGYQNYANGSNASIVTGSFNFVSANSNLTVGDANYNDADYCLVLGLNHIAGNTRHRSALIAGQYSASLSKPAYMVIGNGTSTGARSNAFIVYDDGDIVISKRQGDVSMGNYE